jgi:hypothetical protein
MVVEGGVATDLLSRALGEPPDLKALREGEKGIEAVLLHVHLTIVHEVEDHLQVLLSINESDRKSDRAFTCRAKRREYIGKSFCKNYKKKQKFVTNDIKDKLLKKKYRKY